MSHGTQRIIVVTQQGVGIKYIPINRYADDLSLTVVPNGATLTVDYTLENIIRAPSVGELDGTDLTTGANATWTALTLASNAFRGKLGAYALRLNVTATGTGAIAAAIAEDGGVFVDETTEANEATANDMTLFPAVPVAAIDRYNFGFTEPQSSFTIDTSTVGTGTYTVVWEYWNGTAWTALAGVTDASTGFKTTGAQVVSWTLPSDWVASTINSQGPFYYIRAEIQTGTVTAVPVGEQAFDSALVTIRIAQA